MGSDDELHDELIRSFLLKVVIVVCRF